MAGLPLRKLVIIKKVGVTCPLTCDVNHVVNHMMMIVCATVTPSRTPSTNTDSLDGDVQSPTTAFRVRDSGRRPLGCRSVCESPTSRTFCTTESTKPIGRLLRALSISPPRSLGPAHSRPPSPAKWFFPTSGGSLPTPSNPRASTIADQVNQFGLK